MSLECETYFEVKIYQIPQSRGNVKHISKSNHRKYLIFGPFFKVSIIIRYRKNVCRPNAKQISKSKVKN